MPRPTKRAAAQTTKSQPIPREVREAVLLRLEPEQRRYLEDDCDTAGFEFAFKGRFLYIAQRKTSFWGGRAQTSPLCRLRYTGDVEQWDLQIFIYSSDRYDEEGDFPFPGGSPEMCFAVAADFYVLGCDALTAGSSYRKSRKKKASKAKKEPAFSGPSGVLPPLDDTQRVPPPAVPTDLAAGLDGPLLADFSAFLRYVDGRTFDLAERTLGLRREPLAEVNALMREPKLLHSRVVQDGVPRVHSCFTVAEALGLLQVVRTLHRGSASSGVADFLALPAADRWWSVIEAMWQRVRWSALRTGAFGRTDLHQSGRFWLAAELARRTEPLRLDYMDGRFTFEAEVLESFLFPFWRDAGLLALTFDPKMPVDRSFEHRSTRLSTVEVTALGCWTFARLAEISPKDPTDPDNQDARDGKWQRREFVQRLHIVAPDFR